MGIYCYIVCVCVCVPMCMCVFVFCTVLKAGHSCKISRSFLVMLQLN